MVFGIAQASAKEPKASKNTVVYIVGVATSFNDSVAYCTEMQVLNDATLIIVYGNRRVIKPAGAGLLAKGRTDAAGELREVVGFEKS